MRLDELLMFALNSTKKGRQSTSLGSVRAGEAAQSRNEAKVEAEVGTRVKAWYRLQRMKREKLCVASELAFKERDVE
jgi:hypothetical protein